MIKHLFVTLALGIIFAAMLASAADTAKCYQCAKDECEAEFNKTNTEKFDKETCDDGVKNCFKFEYKDGSDNTKIIRGCMPAATSGAPSAGKCQEEDFEFDGSKGTFCACDGFDTEYCNAASGFAPAGMMLLAVTAVAKMLAF